MSDLKYSRLYQFFDSNNLLEDFLNLPHKEFKKGGVTLYQVILPGKYGDFELAIVKSSKLFGGMDLINFGKKHGVSTDFNYIKGDGKLHLSSDLNLEFIDRILDRLTDKELIQKINTELEKYFMLNSDIKETIGDKLLSQQNLIKNYLIENNIKKEVIDVSHLKTEEDIENWFENIDEDKENNVKGYNDLDYYPFMIENCYVIEDVSSSSLFICKFEDENTFTWYQTERDCQEDMDSELAWESRQYIKYNIEKNCSANNRIVEYKDGQIVSCNHKLSTLDLLQSYIFDQLCEEGRLNIGSKNTGKKKM